MKNLLLSLCVISIFPITGNLASFSSQENVSAPQNFTEGSQKPENVFFSHLFTDTKSKECTQCIEQLMQVIAQGSHPKEVWKTCFELHPAMKHIRKKLMLQCLNQYSKDFKKDEEAQVIIDSLRNRIPTHIERERYPHVIQYYFKQFIENKSAYTQLDPEMKKEFQALHDLWLESKKNSTCSLIFESNNMCRIIYSTYDSNTPQEHIIPVSEAFQKLFASCGNTEIIVTRKALGKFFADHISLNELLSSSLHAQVHNWNKLLHEAHKSPSLSLFASIQKEIEEKKPYITTSDLIQIRKSACAYLTRYAYSITTGKEEKVFSTDDVQKKEETYAALQLALMDIRDSEYQKQELTEQEKISLVNTIFTPLLREDEKEDEVLAKCIQLLTEKISLTSLPQNQLPPVLPSLFNKLNSFINEHKQYYVAACPTAENRVVEPQLVETVSYDEMIKKFGDTAIYFSNEGRGIEVSLDDTGIITLTSCNPNFEVIHFDRPTTGCLSLPDKKGYLVISPVNTCFASEYSITLSQKESLLLRSLIGLHKSTTVTFSGTEIQCFLQGIDSSLSKGKRQSHRLFTWDVESSKWHKGSDYICAREGLTANSNYLSPFPNYWRATEIVKEAN